MNFNFKIKILPAILSIYFFILKQNLNKNKKLKEAY